MRRQLLQNGIIIAATVLVLAALATASAKADQTLTADMRDVVNRLEQSGGSVDLLSPRDRATLFANNDAINAARLNGELSDKTYQAAQTDFADTNRRFASEAATEAGAQFTVQERSGTTYSPGTDSDYITIVKNKEQIGKMQEGYNRRINDYLNANQVGDGKGANWQNKLDTDFMADPRYVSKQEFMEVAKMNNDAYKNRYAAEYERISRAKGSGKIGPQHVTGYAEEMVDFSNKKAAKIDDMFANPSLFNDPKNRAKVIQQMANEQKYVSRLEALDDFLRKQEGLPPRDRGAGKTLAASGSKRAPDNVATIKEAHAATETSRNAALQELTETFGDVAKKNPEFARLGASDVSKIIDRLPPAERAKALESIRARNPNLAIGVDEIYKRRPGGIGAVDDLAKAGAHLDDAARVGFMRKGLGAAQIAMETLGRVAGAVDVATAAGQMKDYFDAINKALDPSISNDEADALFEKAEGLARTLTEAGALGALLEASPAAATAWGTWLVTRHGGEWVLTNTETGQSINRATSDFFERHMNAWNSFNDWLSGKTQFQEELHQERCRDLTRAIAAKRIRIKNPDNKVIDLCGYIKSGIPISDLIEVVGPLLPPAGEPETAEREPKPDDGTGEKEDCDPASGAAAGSGCTEQQPPVVAGADELDCDALNGLVDGANEHYTRDGGLDDARTALSEIQSKLAAGPADTCQDLRTRVAKGLDKISRLGDAIEKINGDLATCDPDVLTRRVEQLSGLLHASLKTLADSALRALPVAESYQKSRAAFASGDLLGARTHSEAAIAAANAAGGATCSDIVGKVNSNLTKIAGAQALADRVDQIAAGCDVQAMEAEKARLSAKGGAGFYNAMVARLEQALTTCREHNSRDVAEVKEKMAADRTAACVKDYGQGYEAGHVLEDGRYFCKPSQAAADDWCAKKNGTGHHATNINDRGGFDCLPNKDIANDWCRRNNPGSGWSAGAIQADGTFSCHQSAGAEKAAAWADCRKKYGNSVYRVYKRKGQYWCEYGRRPPKGGRRSPQSDADAQAAAAAAAAIAGAIAEGIAKRKQRPQRKCHRNPYTGQIHCGSN